MVLTNNDPETRRATKLVWAHAFLFGAIALACYAAPEIVFGESAWLPLARLAVLLFAAALSALTVFLVGSAASRDRRQTALALLAALAFDVQVPVLTFSQPASLEYLHTRVGIPWFVIPLAFLALVGVTVHCLLRLKRSAAINYEGVLS